MLSMVANVTSAPQRQWRLADAWGSPSKLDHTWSRLWAVGPGPECDKRPLCSSSEEEPAQAIALDMEECVLCADILTTPQRTPRWSVD